jgi:hypothetical protein
MQVILTFFTPATGWHKPLPNMDSPQTLVLVFGEPDHHSVASAFKDLQAQYLTSVIAGCASMASVFGEKLLQKGLAVAVIRFHYARLVLAETPLTSPANSHQAGEYLGLKLQAPDLKGILLLTDGLNTQGTELIRGLATQVNPQTVAIVGGLASDRMAFQATWVLHNGVPCSGRACGIGFYGEKVVFASQSRDGFRPFGPERRITRADNRTLYELDHRPALQVYKEYLGDHAQHLPQSALNFPLAIWNSDKQHYAVRVPVAVDETEQSLSFIADIPTGYQTQFMYGSADYLTDGAEDAAKTLVANVPANTPVLAFIISCAARQLIMDEDTFQELEAVQERLPHDSQQFGFYGFGELAPTEYGGGCSHHNATMTLSLLYERP